ncbi:MAG: lysine exporter LysO family protein, partial [Bacillota bacterium]
MLIAIIIVILLGIAAGYLTNPSFLVHNLDFLSTFCLTILLLGVGIDLGSNQQVIDKLKQMGWKVLLIPLLIAVGSILGTSIVGVILDLSINESSAIGAGFGWYSLSGVILTKIHSADLGVLAFLTNVLREVFAIILIPLLASWENEIIVVAPGGATTMDTTLPLIS